MVASIHGSSIAAMRLGSGGAARRLRRCAASLEGRRRDVGRVVELDHARLRLSGGFGEVELVDDARRGGDEVEIIFAGQPLLDDLEVEEAQKAAALTLRS